MQQEGISKGDVLQKLAGLSFIAGAILLIVSNALFPRPADPSDAAQFVQKIADSRGGFWEVDTLLLAVGIWAVMIGATGVYRSISTGGAAAWARLGYYGVIVGVTVWTVLLALNLGLSQAVKLAGTDRAVQVMAMTTSGVFSMSIIVLWLALTFLGIGMVLSAVYPKWAGWAIIVLGVATVIVGILQGLGGPSKTVTNVLFPIVSILTTLWGLVLGIWITRKAW
ncbi:MAG: DUF4386 family protein [Chloroflexi bacterium]|nr:DUF4386 family protein [Chloroflexota bacterium]